MNIVAMKKTTLKSRNDVNEKMVQDYIAAHPECLGLGSLELKARELQVLNGGYIDLLFSNSSMTRFVVEVQLGDVDSSHIVRIADYVERESERWPSKEHVGVLVAENVTTGRYAKFLRNFSKFYHLVVLQMNAGEIDGNVVLNFDRILDGRTSIDLDEQDEESPNVKESVNREWYDAKYGQEAMERADDILEQLVKAVDSNVAANYKKNYIGLVDRNGMTTNWCALYPHKSFADVEFKTLLDDGLKDALENCGLETWEKKGRTIVRIEEDSLEEEDIVSLLQDISRKARDEYCS